MKKQILLFLIIIAALVGCTDPTNTVYETNTEYISLNTYTVTFYANGGTGKMESQTFSQDTEQALSKNGFIAPNGRVFAGWTDDEDSTNKVYDDNQYIKVTKNLSLYALWKMDEGSGDATEEKEWLFDSWIDDEVKPGNGFYQYAVGSWSKDPNGVGVWCRDHSGDDKGACSNQNMLGK
ncbi:MAG: InlB B-repeat-containing protein [Spirochaetales bacterium]|nr:InlB B-repeat-containing protein [Spirochaetales bacterium]